MFTFPAFPGRATAALLLSGLLLAACGDDKKKEDPQPEPTNTLKLELEHQGADGQRLVANRVYQNALGQGYKLSQMRYYLSNVQLRRADGTYWKVPASYHLINGLQADDPMITLNVPYGSYNGLRMSFGVDSAANSRTDQVGDLDPNNGMAWEWSTGYRFLVLEGNCLPVADSASVPLTYHPGRKWAYRVINYTLPQPVEISAARNATAHLIVDTNKIFGGPNQMNFRLPTQRNVMQNPTEVGRVADNVATIFRLDHVHND